MAIASSKLIDYMSITNSSDSRRYNRVYEYVSEASYVQINFITLFDIPRTATSANLLMYGGF